MKYLVLLAAALLSLSSCNSLTPFTQDLYEDLELSNQDIQSVQFYLSKDVILYRELGMKDASINEGKIRVRKGKRIQEIVFKKGTPGVVVFQPKQDRFAVSFETDGDDKFLMFGPNTRMNDRYTLLGKDWNKQVGKITYGGSVYRTSTENAFSALMVNVNKVRKVSVTSDEAEGRKVSDR